MSATTRTVTVEKEESVYVCDRCGNDIGPAPIDKHGGHSVNGGAVAPRGAKSFHAELCESCYSELRRWFTHKRWSEWEGGTA